MPDKKTNIVLGITGASGAAIGYRIAHILAGLPEITLHLVISGAGERTLRHEVSSDACGALKKLNAYFYDVNDIGAKIASGSFVTGGMIVAPCSMRTLASVAHGMADNLIGRAADVQLKERRKLILLARETPLHLGHLRNMCAVTEMGAVIMPPVPAFYHRPHSVDEIINELASRAVDMLQLPIPPLARAWQGEE